MDKTMIHDSLRKGCPVLCIIAAFFAAVPVLTSAQTSVPDFCKSVPYPTCAPGDVLAPVYGGTDATTDKPIVTRCECLYGSEVVPCQEGVGGCPYGKPVTDLRSNIRIALNVIFGFLGIVVIVMIVYGAFEWLTSMGSDDKVKKGRDTMLWAAIGAVAIAVAWTVTSFILHTGRVVGG